MSRVASFICRHVFLLEALWLVVAFAPTGFTADVGGDGASLDKPTITSLTPPKRAVVLSSKSEPSGNSSQGLYIRILHAAGFDARAIAADEVRAQKLAGVDIFIIGGGSGTAFNRSLGEEGCDVVKQFVRKGGGVLASCAGGYSFARGGNAELQLMTIAQARCIDGENGRWARGKGVVNISPASGSIRLLQMFYANGPLWEITPDAGPDRTVALAHFKSDVKQGDDAGGVMPGTPAILGGTYGEGRFVLFSAHPEFHRRVGSNGLIPDAARWVTKGLLAADQPIRFEDVFPSAMQK